MAFFGRITMRWPMVLATAFCLYTLVLLWNVFSAQSLLRSNADARLIADGQRKAAAISDFMVERRNEAIDLSESHEIESYLVNKALGMSMQYGLIANLDAIDLHLRRKKEQKIIRGTPLFSDITYFDENGDSLSEQSSKGASPVVWHADFKNEAKLIVDAKKKLLIASSPVIYKGIYSGVIVTTSDFVNLAKLLLVSDSADAIHKYQEILVSSDGLTLASDSQRVFDQKFVQALMMQPKNAVVLMQNIAHAPPNLSHDLVLRTSVPGTSLSLVTIIDKETLYGQMSSSVFLYSLSVFPFLLLVASVAFDRQRLRTLQLQHDNSALAKEVTRREALENELRHNTTRLELMANELQISVYRAEEASRAKSDFLATMSHEIRTPMNGVIGMTDLALETDLTDEQRDYLNIVKSSAEGLLTIINDILDFSKIEAGKMAVERIAFDLHSMVADVMKPLSVRAQERNLELICDVQPGVPRRVEGDPGRVRQILINLLHNAIKFTERGEVDLRVLIHAREDARVHLEFAVSDTGIGIPFEKQKLIFEAFTQEDTSTTRRFGGTGLGLTISSLLTKLMGGRIWVESEPGQGSTFHVVLPFSIAEEEHVPVTHQDLRDKHVLLVDDNAVNRQVLGSMVKHWGMPLLEASTGLAALQLLDESSTVDVLLVDYQMPEMDGFELVFQLKQNPKFQHIKIILLSSAASPGQGARCRELGIDAYLTKPVARHELELAIQTLFAPSTPHQATPLITRHTLHEAHVALKILVAEDHVVNQQLILTLLEKWGHTPVLVNNGQEALDELERNTFDLILMDMQMPVMGGLQATRLIRQREATTPKRVRIPIYALTTAALPEEQEAGLQAGVDGYLTKPIDKKQLQYLLNQQGVRPAPAPMHSLPNDFDYAAALAKCDADIVEIIGQNFLATAPTEFKAMEDAITSCNWPELARLAHAQQGIVCNFGASPLNRMLYELNNTPLQASSPPILANLQREWNNLCTALKDHLA
jgi:signal transduction histidine kinase/DNA-binding response OmpR family regulator